MKCMVATEKESSCTAFSSFAANVHSSLSYSIEDPDTVVMRDPKEAIANASITVIWHMILWQHCN